MVFGFNQMLDCKYKITGDLDTLFRAIPDKLKTKEFYSQLIYKPIITCDKHYEEKCVGVITKVDIDKNIFEGIILNDYVCVEIFQENNLPAGVIIG